MIEVKVNGQDWRIHPESTIMDILRRVKISSRICVVERNGKILDRKSFGRTILQSGDRIEIIRMMGGG